MQSLNVRQIFFDCAVVLPGEHVGRQIPVAENEPADADAVHPAGSHHGLRNVRQILLEVGVGRADHRDLGQLPASDPATRRICRTQPTSGSSGG